MHFAKRRNGGLGLALGLAFLGSVQATTLEKMHVDDMSAVADTVIVGTVSGQETVNDNGISRVITFRVDDAVTGRPGREVTVRVPGGSIESGGIRVGEINAGEPAFGLEAQTVLFLTPAGDDGHRRILGYSQGQFAVRDGMVQVPDLAATLSLADFKARIKAHAQ